MKAFLQYLPLPGIVALLCAVLMALCAMEGNNYIVSWICFHTWALYFLAGCNIPQGMKAFANYMLGGLAGPIIILLIPYAGGITGGGSAALTLACAFVTFFVICLEKCKFTNFVPASFCGASAFFALLNGNPEVYPFIKAGGDHVQAQVMLRLAIGFLVGGALGWATVALQVWYKSLIAGKTAPATA
jgi:hypothetical protein